MLFRHLPDAISSASNCTVVQFGNLKLVLTVSNIPSKKLLIMKYEPLPIRSKTWHCFTTLNSNVRRKIKWKQTLFELEYAPKLRKTQQNSRILLNWAKFDSDSNDDRMTSWGWPSDDLMTGWPSWGWPNKKMTFLGMTKWWPDVRMTFLGMTKWWPRMTSDDRRAYLKPRALVIAPV